MSDNIDLQQTDQASRARARRERGARYGLLWMLAVTVLMVAATALLLPRAVGGLGPDTSRWEALRAFLPTLLVAGLIGGSAILLGALVMGRANRAAKEDLRKTADVLPQSVTGLDPQRLPPVPGTPQAKLPAGQRTAFILATLLSLPVLWLTMNFVDRLLPKYEGKLDVWIPMAFYVLMFVVISSVLSRRMSGQARGSVFGEILHSLGRAILILLPIGAVVLGVPPIIDWMLNHLGHPLIASLLLLGGGLLAVTVMGFGIAVLPTLWVFFPVRRADYEGALRRVRRMRRANPKGAMALFLEGTVLDYAGRYAEAEELLRESLIEGQAQVPAESQAVALENQGYVYLKQGRYEEAQRAFEGSISIRPEGSGPYSGLAEVYLRQGIEPQRALDLAEKALQRKGASFLIRYVVDTYRWAEMWGNKAWALALLGDHQRAQQALDQAFRHAPRGFKAEMAMLDFRAAQVARLKGDSARAIALLRQASQLDPEGGAGRLAAEALRAGV